MKRQIRRGTFETNSSSTHSLTICDEYEFKKWKNGELLFDYWNDKFVERVDLTDKQKKEAEKKYNDIKSCYYKDWEDLSDDEKSRWYNKYQLENELVDEDTKTYDDYFDELYLETFVEEYTTKNGDKVVCFGKYGYDG